MRIASRIWSGIAIILAGYVLTVVAGWMLAQRSAQRLEAARNEAVPDALQMQELHATHDQIAGLYLAAVTAGEPEQLKEADKLVQKAAAELTRIAAASWMPDEERADIAALATRFAKVNLLAQTVYGKQAANQPVEQTALASLADERKALEEHFHDSVEAVRGALGSVLADVANSGQRVQYLNLILLVIVLAISIVLVNLILRRSVVRPLATLQSHLDGIASGEADLTKRIPVSQGRDGKAANDELTQLGVTLNRFLDQLQELVKRVGAATERVVAGSSGLGTIAQRLNTDAGKAREQSGAGAEAVSQVAGDLQTVAAAIEQMIASIQEVSTRAQEAARTAGAAVERTHEADAAINELKMNSAACTSAA
jgi:methyl-accepting chemotaxis protein